MTELKPCRWCGAQPAEHTTNPAKGPVSYAFECVSDACAMRIVKTHFCGDRESAVEIWNGA